MVADSLQTLVMVQLHLSGVAPLPPVLFILLSYLRTLVLDVSVVCSVTRGNPSVAFFPPAPFFLLPLETHCDFCSFKSALPSCLISHFRLNYLEMCVGESNDEDGISLTHLPLLMGLVLDIFSEI